MTNRAQVIAPFQIDVFAVLQPGDLITFTDKAPNGFYEITPDTNQAPPVYVKCSEFSKYFKYYVQSQINF